LARSNEVIKQCHNGRVHDPTELALGSARNLSNAVLCAVVVVPGAVLAAALFAAEAPWHPLVVANVIFALNIDLLFWLIALAQRSTWLIDPHWTTPLHTNAPL
jgi:hypothetical protein